MTGKATSVDEGCKLMAESLCNGTALEKFKQMLVTQKVDEKVANELCYGNTAAVLPDPKYTIEIKSQTSGMYLLEF